MWPPPVSHSEAFSFLEEHILLPLIPYVFHKLCGSILCKAMGEGVMSVERTLGNLKIFHAGDRNFL